MCKTAAAKTPKSTKKTPASKCPSRRSKVPKKLAMAPKKDTYASLMKKIINDSKGWSLEDDNKENTIPIPQTPKRRPQLKVEIKSEPIDTHDAVKLHLDLNKKKIQTHLFQDEMDIKPVLREDKEEAQYECPIPSHLLCECCSPPLMKYSEEHMTQYYNPNSTFYQMMRVQPAFED